MESGLKPFPERQRPSTGGGEVEIVSGTATGTDTYALVGVPTQTAYSQSKLYRIAFTNANTGASTLNIDGLGAADMLKQNGDPLVAGDISAGGVYIFSYDGTSFQLDMSAGSVQGGLVYMNNSVPAGNTIANTAVETAFDSLYAIQPLADKTLIRIKLWGVYSTDAVLAPTIRGKIKLTNGGGDTIVIDTGAITSVIGATNRGWSADITLSFRSTGVTATLEAQGFLEFATAATVALVVNAPNTSTFTIDATVAQTIKTTVQWGTADADNTITLRVMEVYQYNVLTVDPTENPVWGSITGTLSDQVDLAAALAAKEATANKDASGGYVGLDVWKIKFRNAANTFTSFLVNAATAARTYTFQNRNGTIADDTDLALKANLASPTFTGTPAAPTAASGTNTTQIATTAYVGTEKIYFVVLGSDQTNNNVVANTMQDITGLSFNVVNGETYWFKVWIFYTAALVTTGARFAVSASGAGTINYESRNSVSATNRYYNTSLGANDLPAAASASSGAAANNVAQVEGTFSATANGTIIARFASEITLSAIVAKAGHSHIQYKRLV